jgi:acetyl esterase/lipase
MLLLLTSTPTRGSTKKMFITCEFFQWLTPLRRLDLCRRGEGKKEPMPTLPTAFGNRSHAWRRSQRSFAISRCRLLPDNWLANGNLYETLDLSCNFAVAFNSTALPTAAQNNLPREVREMARKVMMPVVFKVPGMDRVKVVQNVKYTKTDDPNILMDIYLPPDVAREQKRPAVIFIHGGAKTEYTPKDWGIYTTWGRLVAASGLVGVTFTHSLEYPGKSLEKGAHDVRAAIDYVGANADKYHIDKDRICLIAYSAGGPMLSLAMRGEMPFVRCLVAFYAFMDIQQSDYRKTETPETLQAFSPIIYLRKDPNKIPPLFIGRAGRDEVPTMDDSIDRFVKEALVRNIAFTLANHPQGVHSFDNQNDDERSREIIRGALAFIKLHLEET